MKFDLVFDDASLQFANATHVPLCKPNLEKSENMKTKLNSTHMA